MGTSYPARGEHQRPQRGQALIRIIRRLLRRHTHAMQLYISVLEATDDPEVHRILQHILDEEREHHQEFQRLLTYVSQHEQPYDNTASENERNKAA